MIITLKNNDTEIPAITRLMRVDPGRNEIDCVSEAQLLPEQTADFEVGEGQSLVVFTR